MLDKYFKELWFSQWETKVFTSVYSLWTQPASTIAKYSGIERTTVYKILLRLTKEGLLYETHHKGIKHFFVPDSQIIKKYIDKKINKYTKLEENYDNIEIALKKFEKYKNNSLPKISLFDWQIGIKNIYEDIIKTTLEKKYISIRLFASNTVENQVILDKETKTYSHKLFNTLQEHNINIETFLWNGISLMENITKTFDFEQIYSLPASNSSVNIYLVWDIIYIIIFKESHFAIKIESEDLGNTFHFLFDNINEL